MKKIGLIILVAAVMVGCGDGPKTVKTLTLTEEEQVINKQQNAFSLDLLKRVNANEKETNVFISPLSVAVLSSMLANGAEGNTLTQILNTIGASGYDIADLNDYYKYVLENLPHLDKYTDMKIADAIWLDDAYQVKDEFVRANKTYYKAQVDVADLANPAMAKVVNDWAKKSTNGLIKEVVDESMFQEDTRMVLGNAIYFMSKWANEFSKSLTENADFTMADGKSVTVKMMNKNDELYVTPDKPYEEGEADAEPFDARMLRLYFKDSKYCADIVLPREGLSCDAYLAGLDMDKLNELKNMLGKYQVKVKLPKFKLRYHRDLEEDMQALGMTDVFGGQSNLRGITEDEQLYLSRLFQDSYIELDEEGVKAAAVTIGIAQPTAVLVLEAAPFIVDRPFLLFIREAQYGTILFAGKIGEPK